MLKLGSVIKVIKVILRVGDQDKEKIQSLPSVQITDPALRGDPSGSSMGSGGTGRQQCQQRHPRNPTPYLHLCGAGKARPRAAPGCHLGQRLL